MNRRSRFVLTVRLYTRGLYLAGLLHVWPLERVVARVSHDDRFGIPRGESFTPDTAAAVIERLFRPWTMPFTGRCLVQSLVLFAWLRPLEPRVRLIVGVRAEGEHPCAVVGHAWVTVDGRPLFARDRTASAAFQPVITVSGDDACPAGCGSL